MGLQEDNDAVTEFKTTLDGLTFNSRPIITTLTQLAEDNINFAQEFVSLIETRLERCVPSQKLFTFYVLDSICKNAGSPYTIYFSRNLDKLFRKTYLLVDNQTRTKMISMFKTWMVPLPTGDLMLDQKALDNIEQFLIKASALHRKGSTPPVGSTKPQMVPQEISVQSLLSDIDQLTVITQSKLNSSVGDSKLQAKLAILGQLKLELQKEQLSKEFLTQVQQQLRQIFAQEQQQQRENSFLQEYSKKLVPQVQRTNVQDRSQVVLNPSQNNVPISQATQHNESIFGGNLQFNAPFLQQVTASNKINRLSALVQKLRDKSLLHETKESSIAVLAPKLESELSTTNKIPLPPYAVLQDILGDVIAQRETQNLDLLNATLLQVSQQFVLNANNPLTKRLVHSLYRAKPKKCTLCGKRFGNTPAESEAEIQHLDWHFRVNKKIKGIQSSGTSSAKVIQSKNWYLDTSQWANFKDEDIISTSIDVTASEQQPTFESKDTTSDEQVYKKMREKYVVVPDYATDMKFQCPICTEYSYGKYDDELGEWIWSNCIQVIDKFFHATCYYEATKNQKSDSN